MHQEQPINAGQPVEQPDGLWRMVLDGVLGHDDDNLTSMLRARRGLTTRRFVKD